MDNLESRMDNLESRPREEVEVGDTVFIGREGTEGTVVAIGGIKLIVGHGSEGCYEESIFDLDDVGGDFIKRGRKEVTVTRERLAKIWDRHLADERIMPAKAYLSPTFEDICKDLGI